MSTGRPHATLGPSAVLTWLEGAHKRSQKELRSALGRARAVLQHVDLREAEQQPLFPR